MFYQRYIFNFKIVNVNPLTMKRILFLLFFIITAAVIGCKKVKPGVETSIRGYVIDSVKNKRLANATVLVLGCSINPYNGSRQCYNEVHRTKTDANGSFKTAFVSDGKYVGYSVAIEDDENYVNRSGEAYTYKLNPGVENNLIVNVIEMNLMKFNLKVLKTDAERLAVYVNYKNIDLPAKPLDTTLEVKILPDAVNNVFFIAYYPNDVRKGFREYPRFGKESVVFYEKIIEDTKELPLYK
ncbi:carboxypeptidase-like regulatory domain-containing protein [Pedobacter sp.]